MAEPLSKAVSVVFDGFDADDHLVEADQLGQSMFGAGRLYTAVYQFYFLGEIPKRLTNSEFRVLIGPTGRGSLSYAVWVLLQHGRLAAFPELLFDFSDFFIPEFIKGIFAKRSGNDALVEDAVEKMCEMARENTEIAKRTLDFAAKVEDHRHAESMAMSKAMDIVLGEFASRRSENLIQFVDPVGRSTRLLTHAKNEKSEFQIDEPAAEVIRSKGELEVGDVTSMKVKLEAVDKQNRSCKFVSDLYPSTVKGKITDPALDVPNNVYTRALDAQSYIEITAKPALRDGILKLFYISDAKPILE